VERNFLVVAADGQVRETLIGDLRDSGINITLAESGAEAVRVAQAISVDAVLVESHIPDMSVDELRSRLLDIRPECNFLPLTSYRLVRNSTELLGFENDDFMLKARAVRDLLRGSLDGGNDVGFWPWEERGSQSLLQVIDVLVGLLEIEYKLFASSSHQAMQLARATAEELGAHEEMLTEVVLGALLRDVGKLGLDLEHNLPEARDEDGESRHSEHVSTTLRLFEHIDFPWKVMHVVRHHHEHYDGSGIPDGLRGREIPMGSRILSVVDAYVEMTCAKDDQSQDPETALRELVHRSVRQFDPEVVEAFHRVIDKRLAGRKGKAKPSVLIVEPQKQFRRLLKMRLSNEGLEVHESLNCDKAMGAVLRHSPNLVLVALDDDTNAGFQLLQEMQQDEKLRRLPLAFLAKRRDRVLELRALRLGVDDFLYKSDDIEQLVARVANILLRQALRDEGGSARPRRGISGSLDSLGLADMIQTLSIGMKTACLSLKHGETEGKIWFENGTPRHAETEDKHGERAFYEMVRWRTGEFIIEHGVKTDRVSLEKDAMFLLMEGLRLLDEENNTASAAS
jgi:response regulator RpfG family c-di-GMP phosphodiesterase